MSHPSLSSTSHVERWPIAGRFTISRGAKTEAVVVVTEISDGRMRGRGECVPYARYGETVDGVLAAIAAMAGADRARARPRGAAGRHAGGRGAQRARLRAVGPGGEADRPPGLRSSPVFRPPQPVTTAYTISLGDAGRDGGGRRARPPAARC